MIFVSSKLYTYSLTDNIVVALNLLCVWSTSVDGRLWEIQHLF